MLADKVLKSFEIAGDTMNIVNEVIPLSEKFPFSASCSTIQPLGDSPLLYHWHECFEISFVRSGEGVYYVNGQVFSMIPGDVILFNNMEPHAWHATSKQPMVQPVIVFDPALIWKDQGKIIDSEYLKPFYGYCTNYTNKLPSGHPITKKIFKMLNQILEEYNKKPKAYELMIKTKMLEVMTYLIRYFQTDEKEVEPIAQRKQKLVRLQKVLEFTNTNYIEVIKIDEAARLANMSTAYFSTFFRQTIGITYSDYITKLRISKTLQRMEVSDETIASIAFSCGFNSLSNFYHAFKKITGESPSKIKGRK